MIQPKECLNQSWNKESRQDKAPNIYKMIQWFNTVRFLNYIYFYFKFSKTNNKYNS